jgi:signal transduction histidine kinase
MIKSFKEPTFLFFCYKLGGIIWLIFLVVILCENFRKVTERKEFELIRQVKESHNLQKCMIEIERCIFGDESIKGAFCALQDFSTEIKQALPILKRIFSGNDADTRKITIDLKKAIERIESSRDYLLKLTKNLDDLSCLNGVAYSLIDLNKLLKQIVCQKMLNSKEIKFKMSLDENLPLIEADSNLLKCLAINLLENSKEAILGNGTIKITTRHLSKNDAVEIIFSDTGNGIKAEEKESISKIFKPFYTTKENSDGLGLTIVKEIVSLHKGKISVKKNKDETSFVIELPVYQTNFMQTLSFKDPAVLLAEL